MKAAAKPKPKAKKSSTKSKSDKSGAREDQIVPRAKKAAKIPPPPDLPITKLILDAKSSGKPAVQLPHGEMAQSQRLVVSSSILLEASAGSLLPPALQLPSIVVSGENTTLTLRHVCLKFKGEFTGSEHLVECRSGARVDLIDCRLEGAGLKVCPGARAHLVRSQIHKSSSYGITACDCEELILEGCEVLECEGEGVHSTSSKRLCISGSRMAQNTLSGIVVDGKPGETSIKGHRELGKESVRNGCTLADNAQFGIWVDSGSSVAWERNSLAGNMLGDIGGRGKLDGDNTTYSVGDPCQVWCEEKLAVQILRKVAAEKPIIQTNQLVKSIAKHKRGVSQA
eukprot:Skav226514  [mRNA]  locus=scaffold1773:80184:84249:- [translate_table: standard]